MPLFSNFTNFKIVSELKAHIISGKHFLEKFGLSYLKEFEVQASGTIHEGNSCQIDFIKLKLFAL